MLSRLRPTLIVVLALAATTVQFGTTLALYNRAAADGANKLTAGSWAYYLHNNPTPPTANTAAQYNLTMTAAVPSATSLFFYDTNNANRAGRGITRSNAPSAGLVTAYGYVNWRTAVLAAPLTLTGNVTVDVWSATNTGTANRSGSLIAYLRDYNPTAGTYTEIANGTYAGAYAIGGTYYESPIAVAVTASYALPAGHQLELKLESPTAGSQNDMLVAYDTTTYPSYVRVR